MLEILTLKGFPQSHGGGFPLRHHFSVGPLRTPHPSQLKINQKRCPAKMFPTKTQRSEEHEVG